MKEFLETIQEFLVEFLSDQGLRILQTLIWLLLGLIVIRLVRKSVRKATLKNKKLDSSASVFIVSLVTVVLYIGLAILLCTTLGFSTASVIAAFTAVAAAIVLGLQDTMSSITNGIIIIFTRPFKAGDYVDIAGTEGTVKAIRLFNTKLLTPDNIEVIIPNSAIVTATMKNYSDMSLRRADIVVPCPRSVDVNKVKEVLLEVARTQKGVVAVPEPFCRITNYGTNSLDFTLRAWVVNSVFWDVKFDLLERVVLALRENDIVMPYSQLDVHMVEDGKEDEQ